MNYKNTSNIYTTFTSEVNAPKEYKDPKEQKDYKDYIKEFNKDAPKDPVYKVSCENRVPKTYKHNSDKGLGSFNTLNFNNNAIYKEDINFNINNNVNNIEIENIEDPESNKAANNKKTKKKIKKKVKDANEDDFINVDVNDQNDISFIDELNSLLGVDDNKANKKNRMMCYEESIIENKTNNFGFDNLNNIDNPHVVENSYLEISRHKNLEDESLICNQQKEILGENFLDKCDKEDDKEEVSVTLFTKLGT